MASKSQENDMTDKLRPGDVFQFGAGTLLEQVMSIADGELEQFLFFNRNARRRSANEVEVYTKPLDTQYLVISATPTHGGTRMGLHDDNGGWNVIAAPKGTPLEELTERQVNFYQFGPYLRTAMPEVILVSKAEPATKRTQAIRT
jgi:hypothetical protein